MSVGELAGRNDGWPSLLLPLPFSPPSSLPLSSGISKELSEFNRCMRIFLKCQSSLKVIDVIGRKPTEPLKRPAISPSMTRPGAFDPVHGEGNQFLDASMRVNPRIDSGRISLALSSNTHYIDSLFPAPVAESQEKLPQMEALAADASLPV
jgi:hypothetical protein